MRTLPRHELFHADGRRLLVYGELSGGLHDRPVNDEPQTIHKRLDQFTGTWVGIAPARNARPLDSDAKAAEPCPFCAGGTEVPFPYEAAVFDNRFPSFRPSPPPAPPLDGPIGPALGRCEVVLYTDRHDASFGRLSATELGRVLAVWIDRARELWSDPAHAYVCVFENRGAEVGATIAHPHGQIYALDHVPPITAAKAAAHRRHQERAGRCLSCDVTLADAVLRPRRLDERELRGRGAIRGAVAVRGSRAGTPARSRPSRRSRILPSSATWRLALRDVVLRYDALFDFPLPYMMVAQEAPNDAPDWHLAFEFYPLHRASGATKIRASVETGLGLFLNDVAPEDAARRLAGLAGPGRADRARNALHSRVSTAATLP